MSSSSLGRFLRRGTEAAAPDPDAPVAEDEGRMTLIEHLRELRSRLVKISVTLVLGVIVALLFYNPVEWGPIRFQGLFAVLSDPARSAIAAVAKEREIDANINFGSITSPLMLMLKVSLVAALVGTCPLWLYQIWAFIVPGLHRNERKWTLAFVGTAAPLFILGVVIGYLAMPLGISVLIEFTPSGLGLSNLVDAEDYLDFILRLLLVFGVAFEIPIFVLMLNVVGVLSSKRLAKWRAGILFGIFVFAAIATPSVDPLTMLLLAGPMSVLFVLSEILARVLERSRRRKLVAQGFTPDEWETDD